MATCGWLDTVGVKGEPNDVKPAWGLTQCVLKTAENWEQSYTNNMYAKL